MNEISSLPSLNELLGQNPNLRPNAQASNFARNFESQLGASGQSSANINAISPVAIDKTTPTERVNAPGFANMFENFIKGVDAKKKISKTELKTKTKSTKQKTKVITNQVPKKTQRTQRKSG